MRHLILPLVLSFSVAGLAATGGDVGREAGEVSVDLARSGCGQASSKETGVSRGSGPGGGDRTSSELTVGATTPAALASARSRSFREVEENSRFRRGRPPAGTSGVGG